MYISNAGPHQPMAASFFNLQDQIKYVCMYVCMYKGLITKTMALQAVQVLSSLIRFFAGP